MKKFLLLVLIFTAVTLPVRAEQSVAEEYRQMFRSGNFYVEYQMFLDNPYSKQRIASPKFTLAGQNGNRMQRITIDKLTSQFWNQYGDPTKLSTLYYSFSSKRKRTNLQYAARGGVNGFGFGLFSLFDSGSKEKNYPDTLFRDGKYYRFRKVNEIEDKLTSYGSNGTVYGKVLAQEDLNSPTLNQDDEWNYIREDLSLPDELAVFCWDEHFRDNFTAAPVYNGSSKRTVDGKEYDCDQYVVDVKSLAGTVIAQEAYNMLYDGGKLVRVQKYLLRNGKEELVVEAEIINISPTVPADAFTIGKKIKVYAAENGDMQDLLEQPVLVETLGVK